MPGMPQGRDINEADPKSVTMVTVGNDGTVESRTYPTSIAQFERVAVEPDRHSGLAWHGRAHRWEPQAGSGYRQFGASGRPAHVARSYRFSVASPPRPGRRKAEADSRAAPLDRTWVEKVELNVGPGTALPLDR